MLTRFLMVAATGVVALGLGLGFSPAYADEHEGCNINAENMPVSAKVKGDITTIGFLISARWGDGVLTLANGEQRKFRLIGAKALETGAAINDFEGEVYNLKNVGDFEGIYYGASTNINLGTLGKGEGMANNARCVIVKYRMTGAGLKVSGPAPGAFEVSFID